MSGQKVIGFNKTPQNLLAYRKQYLSGEEQI